MLTMHMPSPDLARDVELYWEIAGDAGAVAEPYEILPDGNMDILFRFSPSASTVVAFGPATRAHTFMADMCDTFFCVRFRPAQVLGLVDIDPASLVDGNQVVDRLMGRGADSVAEELRSLDSFQQRCECVEAMLRKTHPLVRDARCRRAVDHLRRYGGACPVRDLADGLGLSLRSFERLVKSQIGLPPKKLARLIRLQHLLARLRSGSYLSHADLAYACGYAHQSHMIREMKALTGRSPGAFSFAEPSLTRSPQGLAS